MGLNRPQLQALQCQYRELSEQKQVADSVANDVASQLKVKDVVSVLATVCFVQRKKNWVNQLCVVSQVVH